MWPYRVHIPHVNETQLRTETATLPCSPTVSWQRTFTFFDITSLGVVTDRANSTYRL